MPRKGVIIFKKIQKKKKKRDFNDKIQFLYLVELFSFSLYLSRAMVVSTRSNTKRDSSFEREANEHKLGSWDQFQANKENPRQRLTASKRAFYFFFFFFFWGGE